MVCKTIIHIVSEFKKKINFSGNGLVSYGSASNTDKKIRRQGARITQNLPPERRVKVVTPDRTKKKIPAEDMPGRCSVSSRGSQSKPVPADKDCKNRTLGGNSRERR